MRALVTGGTGFIGSNLVLKLLDQGHEVIATGTRDEQDLSKFPIRMFPREFVHLDWNALGPVAVVFHQAANNDTTVLDRDAMFRENVENSLRLFEQAVAHGCRRIVYASSCAVYGDAPAPYREDGPAYPLNPYGESKLELDYRALEFSRAHPEATIVGLRYSNVYGPRETHKGRRASMVYQLAQQMLRGNPRIFRDGEQRRDYLFIGDAVRANLLAASVPSSAVVNCGSGTATSFNGLVALLNEALGLERVAEYFENPHKGRYQDFTQCDLTRARAAIGFVPEVDLREGIRRYRENGFLEL